MAEKYGWKIWLKNMAENNQNIGEKYGWRIWLKIWVSPFSHIIQL